MWAQKLARLLCIRQCPRYSVELVITHHCKRIAALDHGACNAHDLHLFRATIYKIADKNDLARCMLPDTFALLIAQLLEQRLQRRRMAMNIPYQVVHQCVLSFDPALYPVPATPAPSSPDPAGADAHQSARPAARTQARRYRHSSRGNASRRPTS